MLKILNNKIIIFILSRYFSYFLQFINSLVIAYVLGPFYLGIWGFLALVLQYLNFGNFGVDIALNVSLSTGDLKNNEKQSKIASNAVLLTFLTCTIYIAIALVLYFSNSLFFEKYMFTRFIMVVTIISCLNYFNIIFLNIFRTYSLFTPISVFQTIIQLFQLPMFLFFKETQLIWSLLAMMLIAHLISIFLFLKKMPIKLQLKFDAVVIKNLLTRGLTLLSYNLTFYILLLSTRSMVGYFYPVETMGLFTFSANIAAALIVGLSSLEFVLFPKMLNRLSSEVITERSIKVFTEVRYIYMATAFLVTIIGLLCYPILLIFFRDYVSTESVFSFLVICQVIISSGFGYSTLIISRGKEMFLVIHGLIALMINLILSFIAFKWFNIDYSYMAAILIFSFIYYDIQVIRKGRKLLGLKSSFNIVFNELLPLKSLASLIILLVAIATQQFTLFYLLSLVLFLVFNRKGFKLVKEYGRALFNEPTVVNI